MSSNFTFGSTMSIAAAVVIGDLPTFEPSASVPGPCRCTAVNPLSLSYFLWAVYIPSRLRCIKYGFNVAWKRPQWVFSGGNGVIGGGCEGFDKLCMPPNQFSVLGAGFTLLDYFQCVDIFLALVGVRQPTIHIRVEC